ncbi:hypothetical protein EV646_10624 [Kribbella antiqua]|uniref:GrpE protein n=1 Tax=Kribbella antiqua TaxID=2512217 RepID=A0A4R2IUY1_9ACTN|nr:hypothetical protein [Kribbella antiqua]TCO46785.1 hypothetical protein EV646_10624 [Kribbella antiqua]
MDGWRQRKFHKAFRIDEPRWDQEQRDELAKVLAGLEALERAAVASSNEATGPDVDHKALAEAATNLWRAQRKLSGGDTSTQTRQAGRYLQTCRNALTDAGLIVQDHEGDAFHPGRSLEVLVYEEDPALTAETVLETVRPSIYFHAERIQMGQVIVGRPANTTELETSKGSEHA